MKGLLVAIDLASIH